MIMEQTSVISQIFGKYFEALKKKLDHVIIENLKKVFERDDESIFFLVEIP